MVASGQERMETVELRWKKTFHEHRSSVMEAVPKRFRDSRGPETRQRCREGLAADTGASRGTGSSEVRPARSGKQTRGCLSDTEGVLSDP